MGKLFFDRRIDGRIARGWLDSSIALRKKGLKKMQGRPKLTKALSGALVLALLAFVIANSVLYHSVYTQRMEKMKTLIQERKNVR